MNDTVTGGLLVLLGGLVSELINLVKSRMAREERRQKLLRAKYEALCKSLLDSTAELQENMGLSELEAVSSCLPPASSLKLCYLAMIYFPELRSSAAAYNQSVVAYHRFMVQCFDPDIPVPLAGQAREQPEHEQFMTNAMKCRAALEQAIEKNANKYTKA